MVLASWDRFARGYFPCFLVVNAISYVTGLEAEMVVDTMENALRAARAFFNNVPDLAGAIRRLVEENADRKSVV